TPERSSACDEDGARTQVQHLVGHAADQQGGKIGVATRAHHDQAGPVLVGGAQDGGGGGAVHGVAKVDAGSQPRSFQVLGVLFGELDRPSVILEVPLGGGWTSR